MDFTEKQEELEKIISKYSEDIIGNEASNLALSLGIQTSKENKKAIAELENENRLLQIGVVGRVKAGKSSLINAFLFDGESVLPKAATPMTAALTVLSYGEELSAEVDFFSEEDIKNIQKEYQKYKDKKEKLSKERLENLKKSMKRRLENVKDKFKNKFKKGKSDIELQEEAERHATMMLRNEVNLESSYELYKKIEASNIDRTELEKYSKFKASSYSELHEKLSEYVAIDGKFMPFTKSVHIKIPNENLKNIQIVDTPGINDPVQSREAKTRELLKYCDVILIVSPSGQFLNSEDTKLLDRITSKEGIRELFVVASQIDNQLYGSIKRDSNGDLYKALNLIISELSEHMNATILKLKKDFPEVENAYDQLIEQSNDKIIHSSGISQTMITFWDNKTEWDSSVKNAWNNLLKHYPDYFTNNDKVSTLSNLKKLANTKKVKDIIQNVREKKDTILAQRKKEFMNAKIKTLKEYQNSLLNFIDKRVGEINETNINELKKQRKEIAKIKTTASKLLNTAYLQQIDDLNYELKQTLFKEIDNLFVKSKHDIHQKEDTKTKTWTERHGFLWLRKETHSITYTTVRTGAIRNIIMELNDDLESRLSLIADEITHKWKKSAPNIILREIRQQVDDEYFDAKNIPYAFRKVFNQIISFPVISYSDSLPENLSARRVLEGLEADKYIDNAIDYTQNTKKRVKKDVLNYLDNLVSKLNNVKLSDEFFTNYEEYLNDLEEQISKKEMTIETYNRLYKELKKVELNG